MSLWNRLLDWDKSVFSLVNQAHAPWLDAVMMAISSRLWWLPFYVGLLVWLVRRLGWKIVLVLVCLIIASDQISGAVKQIFGRLRPFRHEDIVAWVHLVDGYRPGSFSFVSSHAANTFAVATLVILLFPRWQVAAVMLAWASVVSYSRVYLGVHFPSDVLAGGLLGSLLGVVMFGLTRRFLRVGTSGNKGLR